MIAFATICGIFRLKVLAVGPLLYEKNKDDFLCYNMWYFLYNSFFFFFLNLKKANCFLKQLVNSIKRKDRRAILK